MTKQQDKPVISPAKLAKMRFIGQAHLEPGMNLEKLQALFARYRVVDTMDKVSDRKLDEMVSYIKEQDANSASNTSNTSPLLSADPASNSEPGQ